ncbi:unnamed protein product [Protopolystoma xenopodis]|uniref:Uncharacterized protein n=1 Tax=Protopolystoma xenopodis TaxID=117903 RepID=A0A448WF12_9PLAT|nr:unnamed protein product [Protopolystoma xenopodis]
MQILHDHNYPPILHLWPAEPSQHEPAPAFSPRLGLFHLRMIRDELVWMALVRLLDYEHSSSIYHVKTESHDMLAVVYFLRQSHAIG